MDIGALSMALSNVNLSQQVGIAVVKLAQDSFAQQGQTIEVIAESVASPTLENSVLPHLGANVDIKL